MKRFPKAQQTNQGEWKTFLTFAFCVSRKTLDRTAKKASINFCLTQQHLLILCYCNCEDVTKWTHKRMHKIIDDKILWSMNALMSFNILSVAILAESAKYPTTQPSSRDNAIWDVLPQTLFPLADFGGVPYIWTRFFALQSSYQRFSISEYSWIQFGNKIKENAAPFCFGSCGPFSPQMLLVKSDPHLQITASVTFWPTSKRHKYKIRTNTNTKYI